MLKNNLLYRAVKVIPESRRRKGIWLIPLLVISSWFDFLSLASFMPLMAMIVDPGIISDNTLMESTYRFFNFTSYDSFIAAVTCAVLFFVLIKNLFGIWVARVKARYAFTISHDLATAALTANLRADYHRYIQIDASRELSRMTSYPFAFANNILLALITFASEAMVCFFILIGVALYDPRVLTMLLVILVPTWSLYKFRKKRLERINSNLREKLPSVLKQAKRVVEGFFDIIVYSRQVFFSEHFDKTIKDLTSSFIKDRTMQLGTARINEITVSTVICALILYTLITERNYQQTLLLLGVYAGASFRVIPSINRMLIALQQMRMYEFLLEELNPTNHNKTYLQESKEDPVAAFDKEIRLENISFHYPGGPLILNNVSLTIPKGEKIVITGKSGEGKTSILLVLLGLLQPTGGKILVDEKPVENKTAWLKLLGYVPQNPYLMDGTLLENIAFGIPAADADREKALHLLQKLDLDEWFGGLPNGLNTLIGERGIRLSGGQRQRISIARALYNDADILLLDEVTNHLDRQTEQEIVNTLYQPAFSNKTIILVTHHPELWQSLNKIYELKNGKLELLSEKHFQPVTGNGV